MRWAWLACLPGCLWVKVESSEPIPVEPDLQLLGGTQSHVYDVAVAAAATDMLVSWTEHRQHAGDTNAQPDVFYAHIGDPSGGIVQGTSFTPYGSAQLQSRPFCSSVGCGLVWGDDAPVGFPDRRLLWQRLDVGSLASATDALVTTSVQTHQRSATRVAMLGAQAIVAYADTVDAAWHASLLDLRSGQVAREVALGPAPWLSGHSVTGGDHTFLALTQDAQVLSATLYDATGTPIAGPIVLGDRLPPDLTKPLVAGYHAGEYVIPVLDFETVEVNRPCCPFCAVVQPPTCVIDDYHLYVVRVSERGTVGTRECLDCRTDVGVNVPLVTSAADGVYMMWAGDLVARVTASDTPAQPAWRQIQYPIAPSVYPSRELTDLAALSGRVVIVGRYLDLVPDHFAQGFVARITF